MTEERLDLGGTEITRIAFSSSLSEAVSKNVLKVPKVRSRVVAVRNLVYKQVFYDYHSTALKIDLLYPVFDGPVPAVQGAKPCIVYVAGGGFVEQFTETFIGLQVGLVQAGYVVASVQHRLVPESQFPEPLEDVKAAVRWLRAHAETYGIDKDRIGVMGDSAGGYMAAMMGATNGVAKFDVGEHLEESSDVRCVADLYGCNDLTVIGAGYDEATVASHRTMASPEALFLNGISYAFLDNVGLSVFDAPADRAAEASPFTYLSPDTPPFLLLHGTADTLNSPLESSLLHEKLKEAGVDSTLYMVEGAEHDDVLFDQPAVVDLLVEFFDKHLK
ncbi:MAG TPA: alpha/beta hydrolase [Candidatus Aphodovivens avistercoris]|nr:alpha/beta hydrolase [Candidatus Aphodovivens avistercoris]